MPLQPYFCHMISVRWWVLLIVLGYFLLHQAQIFWIQELGLVQLQLNLVQLARKLCLVCQERACGR